MVLSADGRATLRTASLLHGHAALTNGELRSVSYLYLLKGKLVKLPDVRWRNCISDPSA
jgi:hypothetical protein